MSLGAFLAAAHVALVKSVARSNGILVSRHCNAYFALLKKRRAHGLLRLLSRWWSVNHLLRLKEQFIDSILSFNGSPTAHPVHIVGIDGHLLRIDELVDEWLATS